MPTLRIFRNDLLTIPQIRTIFPPIPCPQKGTLRDRHGTLARDAMDAASVRRFLRRTKRQLWTAKSCGPGAATLASIRPACAGAATVTKKAAHRGEHEGNRKTIARGRPGCPVGPVVTTLVCFFVLHARLRVRSAPGFPAPSAQERGNAIAQLGRKHAARRRTRIYPHVVPATSISQTTTQ